MISHLIKFVNSFDKKIIYKDTGDILVFIGYFAQRETGSPHKIP